MYSVICNVIINLIRINEADHQVSATSILEHVGMIIMC